MIGGGADKEKNSGGKIMAFLLKNVVPWGRRFSEYQDMFHLTDEEIVSKRIVSFGDGPASFNAEGTRMGGNIISLDPIYQFSKQELVGRLEETRGIVMEQMRQNQDHYKWDRIKSLEELEQILSRRIRSEKVAIKDIKLRTFIAEGNSRNDLAAHVYDITYGSLVPGVDNLVIIDDSIVRGTTLKQSIIGILDRLGPKKIVIVSSSPQVRYPDYYGIDMAKMSEFIAFKAAIELLKDRDMKDVIAAAYRKSKDQVGLPKEQMVNYVKDIYAPFTDEEISAKMVELLTPAGTKAKVEIVYQPLEGLHEACPNHRGDWYFSGDYPTPGGVKMLNNAFIDYIEQVYQF